MSTPVETAATADDNAGHAESAAASVASGADDDAPLIGHGHPLAVAIFRQLQDRSDVDVREVLLATVSAQAGASSARAASALSALGACLADRGSLTRPVYRCWRDDQARPEQWPSAGEIEGTFGRWSAATRAALNGGVSGAVTASRLAACGSEYTPEEMLACVSEWAASVRSGPLVLDAYLDWARGQMSRRSGRRSRYWRGKQLVGKRFGSWEALLDAVELGDRVAAAQPRLSETVQRRELALFWLRASWNAKARGGWLTQAAHHKFVVERKRQLAADGEGDVWLPWGVDVHEMFGSWPAGLLAAGLVDEDEAARREGGRTPQRLDDELLEFVAVAMRETGKGELLSSNGYSAWVAGRRRAGDDEPPAYNTLKGRFGGWTQVIERASRIEAVTDADARDRRDAA